MTEASSITIKLSEDCKCLVTGDGATLYRFVPHVTCEKVPYAEEWPDEVKKWIEKWEPLLTEEAPRAGEGVEQSALDVTFSPRSGSREGKQATYNGFQLYTYCEDEKEGDLKGCFGGLWTTVAPEVPQAPRCPDFGTTPQNPNGP